MSLILAITVVAVFAAILERLGLAGRAREVGGRALASVEVLRDSTRDDHAKEKALRQHAVRLFELLGILCGGSILALGIPLLGVWLLELAGLASFNAVLTVLARIDFLILATVVGAGTYLLIHRVQRR